MNGKKERTKIEKRKKTVSKSQIKDGKPATNTQANTGIEHTKEKYQVWIRFRIDYQMWLALSSF